MVLIAASVKSFRAQLFVARRPRGQKSCVQRPRLAGADFARIMIYKLRLVPEPHIIRDFIGLRRSDSSFEQRALKPRPSSPPLPA